MEVEDTSLVVEVLIVEMAEQVVHGEVVADAVLVLVMQYARVEMEVHMVEEAVEVVVQR